MLRLSLGLAAALAVPAPVWAADAIEVRPEALPVALSAGWEATDEDPAEGLPGLVRAAWRPAHPVEDPGPFGSVRWYRVRLDLSACRGRPLAFYAVAIRDSDEAYLDGVRIGGLGAFPPVRDPGNMLARLYALPGELVNAPGLRTLALRVYHGPRRSSTFRDVPVLDSLSYTARRSWLDQTLVALAGFGAGLALVFAVLYRVHRDRVFLAFGGFTACVVLYLLGGHSAWSQVALRADAPLRFSALAAVLLFLCYCSAVARLLQARLPGRFRLYAAVLAAYAVCALATPDPGLLVWPGRALRLLLFVGLAELAVLTLAALRQGRPGALTTLVAHGFFAAGLVLVDARAPHAWEFHAVVVVVLVLLAVGLHGLALQQVEARVHAVLEERGRLSRELHDTVAQDLVGVSLQLERLQAALKADPAEAAVRLAEAGSLVRRSLASARRAVWGLRAPALERGDLAGALRGVAERLTAGAALEAEVRVWGGLRPLPEEVERNLFSIGREALTNVVRHAQARRVSVELEYGPAEVHLRVEDDGRGFAQSANPGQLGLRGIEERAESMGARLVVRSQPRQGTRVAVTVRGC